MSFSINYNRHIEVMTIDIVYYTIRHEAKTAYSQNTIKSLKTYTIIKSHAVHKT